MRDVVDLLRHERRASFFFIALTQSALGTGAAYVALLLIAYERYRSAWAISLILVADLLPAMLLGPVFGAVADRWSRRRCMVVADVLRAVAFIGIAVVDSFAATLALAALAGIGTGLFTPAALASLPSLVERRRLPAATALYGVTADLGFTIGPALAALGLLFASAEAITVVNGVTFALSALILAAIRFGAVRAAAVDQAPRGALSLLRDAREGLDALAGVPGARAVILGSTGALFFGGLFNVAELPFATDELGASESQFSVLIAAFGVGFAAGSISGSGGGSLSLLRRRFLLGLLVNAAGILVCAASPSVLVAMLAFALAGAGNGLYLVHERVILQETVPEPFLARAFGTKDALASWGFGLAFFAGGALLSWLGPRPVFTVAGAGALLAAGVTALALRRRPMPEERPRVERAEARLEDARAYVEAPTR